MPVAGLLFYIYSIVKYDEHILCVFLYDDFGIISRLI